MVAGRATEDTGAKVLHVSNLVGKIYVLLLAALVAFVVAAHAGQFLGVGLHFSDHQSGVAPALTLEDAAKLFSGAQQLEYLADDEALVFASGHKKLGRLLHSQPLARHIIGYASWLPIVVGIDNDNRVVGLFLQKNKETPGFVKRLEKEGFFASWNGKLASEALSLPVDAVSRATMTSKATIDSFRLRLARFLELEDIRNRVDYKELATETLAWLFLAVAFSGCFFASKLARFRKLYLGAAILIPGFLLGRFFSLELLNAWLINGIPYRSQLYLVIVVFLAIVIPLVSGRAWYCTWFCPYGAAQELIGLTCKKKLNPSGRFAWLLNHLRPSFFALLVLALLAGIGVNLSSVEPFSAFLFDSATAPVLALALMFLLLAIVVRRPWCAYLCPSGQFVELLRVGLSDQKTSNAMEGGRMKVHAVLNILLAIAIIILLLSPTRISDNGVLHPDKKDSGMEAKMASASSNIASQSSGSVKSNQTLATIYARKSVRSFTGAEVSREALTEMVRAGMAAPTARNRQPWQFVIIQDRAAMNSLAEKLPYAKMLASAAAAIIVCGDLEIAKAGGTESMWMLDCSAATQNVLLAAESMGFGAVWTAAWPYEDRMTAVVEVVKLPEHIVPLCVIPVGVPTGEDQPKNKWQAERLHWNTFSPSNAGAEKK